MSARSKLANVLGGLGVVDAALALRSRASLPWLTTLCYHRTADLPPTEELDGGIVDASPAQFEQQIAFLAEHFSFVGPADVADFIHRGKSLPKNPVLITFDDGYKECLTVTLPILARYGAKATFFIPTQFVSERKMFWWDRFAWVLKRAKPGRFRLTYPHSIELDVSSTAALHRSHKTLTDLVKKRRGLDLARLHENLQEAAKVELSADDERRMIDRVLMTWPDIEAMVAAGMDIGSHSHSHRVLQTLELREYESELTGSRRELEERLRIPVTSIAYPVGYPLNGERDLRQAVRDAGYEVGFSCRTGVLAYNNPDALDVPRILMDVSYDLQQFVAMTSVPILAPRSSVA